MTSNPRRDMVTVFSYVEFDLDTLDMRVASAKATEEAILAMRNASLVKGTAEDVPRDALDRHGRFQRRATGWGDLH